MEANAFDSTYNKLISQEYLSEDEPSHFSNQEKQQVSLSMVRPASTWNPQRVLEITLAVLAAVLLAVVIGLGVYYNNLTDETQKVASINRELVTLHKNYNAASQRRDESQERLAKEIKQQQMTKWQLEHQTTRNKYYEQQADKILLDTVVLKSHIPMIEEGCRHCSPGWTFINSVCYFFSFSDTYSRRSWQEARQFCKKHGADLAVVDTSEKQMTINQLINHHQDPSRSTSQSGFWIGLTDVEEEGVWRWLEGMRLIEGYWNDGEPNNSGGEDCAATYPRENPFKGWNDAPCSYNLKWICEKPVS
ncbi:C-type lectin domain family 4 member M-like [Entelurus aequoreus]|uniref:C-type lectin domain family 4 member M-like n=1 Tax=Entelurus aequoreus TaxID=161455 RepID=UPI002B1D1DC9|nr:C-type lectin domain family 4 member M-like [Entelurus aequoreus]